MSARFDLERSGFARRHRPGKPRRAPWSLRSRLLGIIGLSLVTLWSLVAIWMLADLRREMHEAMDDRLASSARMVAGLMGQLPPASRAGGALGDSALDVITRDGLACEVSLLRGEVAVQTARTSGSPGLADAPPGFSTRRFGGTLWRTYVLLQGDLRIATADRVDVRAGLLRDVALAAGIPFAIALTGSLLLLWFGIGHGLRPLERVRAMLAARGPGDSSPLPDTGTPPELQPLVDTIQHLVARMHAAIVRERHFTDDAAHELRTPLTAIKTHLQVLRLAAAEPLSTGVARDALSDAERGVLRLQHTVDQLLLLARLESQAGSRLLQATDAGAAAVQAIKEAELGQHAQGRVAFQAPSDPVSVALPEALLVSALRNLLDNALRHTSAGKIVLSVECSNGGQVRFRVTDEGPGLTSADCAQAAQRFWRRGTSSQGCGLGLSIVSEIAHRHGGAFRLEPRKPRGLSALLTLPVRGEAQGPEPLQLTRLRADAGS